jgi:phospholipid/cholesterol/gamma-HCH transport system substrate-binding protein
LLRKATLIGIVTVGSAAVVFLLVGKQPFYHRLRLKSCFDNVHGLRSGGSVEIAGVDVGIVRAVRVDPNLKGCPVTVDMEMATPYELRIPKDSVAMVKTAGVLGASVVDIDVSQANASPVENYGYLKSRASPDPVDEFMKNLDGVVKHIVESRELERESKSGLPTPRRKP